MGVVWAITGMRGEGNVASKPADFGSKGAEMVGDSGGDDKVKSVVIDSKSASTGCGEGRVKAGFVHSRVMSGRGLRLAAVLFWSAGS